MEAGLNLQKYLSKISTLSNLVSPVVHPPATTRPPCRGGGCDCAPRGMFWDERWNDYYYEGLVILMTQCISVWALNVWNNQKNYHDYEGIVIIRLIHWVVWVLRWSRRRRRWKAWNAWNNPSNDYYYYFVKVITLMARRLFWHLSGLEVIGKDALTKESGKICSWPLMCKSGDDWWHHHWLDLVEDKE